MGNPKSVMVPYGSKMYGILCFAKMVKEPFVAERCIQCIAGYFNDVKRPKESFRGSARALLRMGYLESINDEQYWKITPSGLAAISATINYRAALKSRLLGPRYMTEIRERLYSASNYVFGANEKALDVEDKILSDVEYRLRTKLKQRNSRRQLRIG